MKTQLPEDINSSFSAIMFILKLVENGDHYDVNEYAEDIFLVTDESRLTGRHIERQFTDSEAEQLNFLMDQIRLLCMDPAELILDAMEKIKFNSAKRKS